MAGNLAQLRIEGQSLRRSVAIVSLRQFQSAPIRAFLQYIVEHKEELQALALGAGDAGAGE